MFRANKFGLLFCLSLFGLPTFGVGPAKQAEAFSTKLGGEGSIRSDSLDAFSFPVRNIKTKNRAAFLVGKSFFRQNWVQFPSSVVSMHGLGPLFIAQSCVACHDRDGRGRPPLDEKEEFRALIFRLSRPGSVAEQKQSHGAPLGIVGYGDQVQNFALPGILPEATPRVRWVEVTGKFDDGTAYTLTRPEYRFESKNYGEFPPDVMISPRVAPVVFGLGLLEAISEKEILAQADPEDKDGDGIRGRPNYVWDHRLQKKRLGRFGWKANQPSLFQQNAAAFSGDIGITTSLFPKQHCEPLQASCLKAVSQPEPEISDVDLERVNTYMHLLAVPQARLLSEKELSSGRTLLRELSCTKCHVESYRTGDKAEFSENEGQTIYPYTDLLLHDMGEDLADHRPDFEATGRDWRTPPLWGIGLVSKVNRHTRFLHDGRARSIEEAILWHGGEALASKKKYLALPRTGREQVLKFLESL
jgi:CxxC motif-containing protein (DUF1111 family)